MGRMLERLDREEIRPEQKAMYMCSARCCDRARDQQELSVCIERCSSRLMVMQHAIQANINRFQNRFERCAARCHDVASEMLPPAGSTQAQNPQDVQKAQKKFDSCVDDCAGEP